MPNDKMKEIWGGVHDLIPKMRYAVRDALHKDQEYTVHGKVIQGMERESIRKLMRVYYELTDYGSGIYELLMPLNSFISYKWTLPEKSKEKITD